MWGMKDVAEIEGWHSNIKHHDTLYCTDVEKKMGSERLCNGSDPHVQKSILYSSV